jgi:hypothetical protein
MSNIKEASLNNIYKKTQNYATGAITAFRNEFTRSENQQRNKKLLAYLLDRGYSVIKVKGSYIEDYGSDTQKEVGEESFFVANHKIQGDDNAQLESDLVKLGQVYDQDSILSIRHGKTGELVGTSERDNAFPGMGQRHTVGKPVFGDAQGEFFSRVKGRKFAFESAEEIECPAGFFGKWSLNAVSNEVKEEIEKLQRLAGIDSKKT